MDRAALEAWLAAYERAWRAPGTDVLAELFTDQASYRTAPYEQPHRGLAAIGQMWERERVRPEEPFEMTADVVAVEGDVGVARVEVRYEDPVQEYRDLWVIRLEEDGRCVEFEEWPFWPRGQKGSVAGGPGETGRQAGR